tara:strand:- start:14676 stop:18698 length:4023 start_codon:yes stop_codon:yes gene_type:complete
MAEVKNTFIKSRMNKDLDDRLLSKDEYREAYNVNVSKSEGEDVGSLENVLGNVSLSNFGISSTERVQVTGFYSDDTNRRIYLTATNYTDTSSDSLSNPAPYNSLHYILMADLNSVPTYNILVQGRFLNFSKTHPVVGIDLIEDLLFFTDNRNQPRKINVKRAIEDSSYYDNEENISVAKYNPYKAPSFLKSVELTVYEPSRAGEDAEWRIYNYREDTPSLDWDDVDCRQDFVTELRVPQSVYNELEIGMILDRTVSNFDNNQFELNPIDTNQPNSLIAYTFPPYEQSVLDYEFYIREKLTRVIDNQLKYCIRLNGVLFDWRNNQLRWWNGEVNLRFLQTGLIDRSSKLLPPSLTARVKSVDYSTSEMELIDLNGEWPEVGMQLGCPGKDSPGFNISAWPYTVDSVERLGLIGYEIPKDPQSNQKTYHPNNLLTQKSTTWISGWRFSGIKNSYRLYIERVTATPNVGLNPLTDLFMELVQEGFTVWKESTSATAINGYINIGTVKSITHPPTSCGSGGVSCDWIEVEFETFHNQSGVFPQSAGLIFNNSSAGPYTPIAGNKGTLSAQCNVTFNGLPPEPGSDPAASFITAGDVIQLSNPNPSYDSGFVGDKEFLKDKFVRFAYRFKFEDGENSLISPFTQVAFIPKQNGYFQDYPSSSNQNEIIKQEDAVGASTIVPFMENKVTEVNMEIEMPYSVDELQDRLKVKQIDILYKESDGLAVKIVESIEVDDPVITGNSTKIFKYSYKSTKPIRTLPESEITRVSDKVPIRAMTQSIVGNRVVYGNFIDKHSSPQALNYKVSVGPKASTIKSAEYSIISNSDPLFAKPGGGFFKANFSTVAYPNHSVKQNRTYQVGIVLSDKYGRQSDVILSKDSQVSKKWSGLGIFGDNTLYSNYNSFYNATEGYFDQDGSWGLDELRLLWEQVIPETISGEGSNGYPGIYKPDTYTVITAASVTNSADIFLKEQNFNYISVGDLIKIGSTGPVLAVVAIDNAAKKITLSEPVILSLAPIGLTVNGTGNKLGWYSYKVVVKQTEQEYYNLYLANVSLASDESALVNAFGGSNILLQSNSFYSSLISDNINKLPPDLQEVQPEQAQFGTSDDVLYPRVGFNPDLIGTRDKWNKVSSQFFEGSRFCTVNGIGKITDLGLQSVKLNGINLGRVNAISSASVLANSSGRVVYNFPTTNGNGTGCKVKVGVTTGNTTPNYVVVTNTGRDYKSGDTITVPAHGPSTGTGWVEGQSQWNQFTFAASQTGINSPVGEDISPRTAPGIFNASSDPNAFAVTSEDGKLLGQDADSRNMVFSAFEIKPLNSSLDIFWETSTCGLVADLNAAIENMSGFTLPNA